MILMGRTVRKRKGAMKKGLVGLPVTLLLVIALGSLCFAVDMGIITGGKKGTIIRSA
jgi:hypothetical protein